MSASSQQQQRKISKATTLSPKRSTTINNNNNNNSNKHAVSQPATTMSTATPPSVPPQASTFTVLDTRRATGTPSTTTKASSASPHTQQRGTTAAFPARSSRSPSCDAFFSLSDQRAAVRDHHLAKHQEWVSSHNAQLYAVPCHDRRVMLRVLLVELARYRSHVTGCENPFETENVFAAEQQQQQAAAPKTKPNTTTRATPTFDDWSFQQQPEEEPVPSASIIATATATEEQKADSRLLPPCRLPPPPYCDVLLSPSTMINILEFEETMMPTERMGTSPVRRHRQTQALKCFSKAVAEVGVTWVPRRQQQPQQLQQ